VAVFAGLIEAMINRIADAIERAAADLEAVSIGVFRHVGARAPRRDYRDLLERLGRSGELVAKSRESLASLERALAFVQQSGAVQPATEVRARLRTATRDVTALSDHAAFVGNNLSFVLDATLGMISIDQNDILKIFSVVTVLLLPPSVIGAIYGMNFEHIPGAHEPWGFAGALGIMACSSLLPYWLFRRRGWL
jgi:magnesium transporter